ncbi:helix-turn-helix domain-containing protein [Streptomyces sp. ME03-5709C]|nr:helix-turn-helix domain-containing protein [Streptomyces sp. ME03-5709C]
MTGAAEHPFSAAIRPLVDALGAELVPPAEARGDDVVLSWEGSEVVAVRLPHLAASLDHTLADLERRHGRALSALGRKEKQTVVAILEERGAFSVRHGVETVASALGVSRFTVYNYLNRENAAKGESR